MTEEKRDVALVDAIFGYCALKGIEPDDPHLTRMSFAEVMRELNSLCANNMPYVMISYELRQVGPICHAECHVQNIIDFFTENPDWGRAAPSTGEKLPSNVVSLFPAPRTKH